MRTLFKNIHGEPVNEITYTINFLSKLSGSKIYVGTDSQVTGRNVYFATVIAYRFGTRGCHFIYHKWKRKKREYGRGDALIQGRLKDEIEKTMEVVQKLSDSSIKVHQIDFDLNNDPEHKSNGLVQMATGWAKGLGYNVSIKPDEQVATKAANWLVR